MFRISFTEEQLRQILAAYKLAIKHVSEVQHDLASSQVMREELGAFEAKIVQAFHENTLRHAKAIGIELK